MDDQNDKRDQFDPTGEAIGYISLDQAILQARRLAQRDEERYRRRMGWEEIVWSEIDSEQREDTYRVVLQFRRPARGLTEEQTGEEEFAFDLMGELQFRQVLAWPEGVSAPGPPPVAPPAVGPVDPEPEESLAAPAEEPISPPVEPAEPPRRRPRSLLLAGGVVAATVGIVLGVVFGMGGTLSLTRRAPRSSGATRVKMLPVKV